jgi:DNA-binding NarL/FixJ family response regulator
MIDSIASNVSALAAQGQAAVATKAQAVVEVAVPSQAPIEAEAAVTVELSAQAQAKELKTEGYSVSEIATKLKLDEKTIDSYLGVNT